MRDDELKDFNEFLTEFQAETDRGAALVGAALIDQRLKETLAAFFADRQVGAELLDAGNAPLGQLSARTKAALCLVLIDRDEYHECNLIRKIRNEFAHRVHGTTFRDPKIAANCFKLKMSFAGHPSVTRDSARLLFTNSVFMVALGLMYRSERVAAERRVIKTWAPLVRMEALANLPPKEGPAPVPPES